MVGRWKLSTVTVDEGPTGFSSNVTTSCGPWPGPRIEAGKGAASATSDPSRIDQTSRVPMEFSSGHLLWVRLGLQSHYNLLYRYKERP
jgi:hypothetical protein